MRHILMWILVVGCRISSSDLEATATVDATDDADDAGPSCSTCTLVAVHPEMARTGDTIVLEGTFAATATVDFPGAPGVPAAVIGAHRATAVVPAGATSGELRVTTGGQSIGPVRFRRVPFAIGVRGFTAPEQAEQARTLPGLARAYHCALAIGSYLYLFGSDGGQLPYTMEVMRSIIHPDGAVGEPELHASYPSTRTAPACAASGRRVYVISGDGTGSVAQAPILADGSLGAWTISGAAIATPRFGATAEIIGDSLYVIGGIDSNATLLGTIERSHVAPDGSLGPFSTSTAMLATPRTKHVSLVTANALYVIGGDVFGGTASVERAPVGGDGSLGPFAAGPTLSTPRLAPAGVRVGDSYYVIGGVNSTSERATIACDGTLGPWSAAPELALPEMSYGHTATIAGNHLYVIGGLGLYGALTRRAFLRAPLDESSGLSALATSSSALAVARHSHTATAIGRHLYVLGGRTQLLPIDTIARAQLGADGSIGAFSNLPGKLAAARAGHVAVIGGQFLIVLGGLSAQVEQARIAPDGTLGAFGLTGIAMTTAREHHSAAVANDILYVVGGRNGSTLATVERAVIAPNLGVGGFTASGTLTVPREGHTSVVLGNKLYVIGGRMTPTPYHASVEVATINADGTLGPFAAAGTTLQAARAFHTSAVIGRYLYVLGGENAGTNLASVERAPIGADGTLGAFSTVSGTTLQTPRNKLAAVALGSSLVLIGGTMGTLDQGILASIERATLE